MISLISLTLALGPGVIIFLSSATISSSSRQVVSLISFVWSCEDCN